MIDHVAQAQSRVYAQYRNKPKFMSWIAINGEIGNQFEQAYQDISESYDIDTAGTQELNVIGRIVGVNRSFESAILIDAHFFGSSQFGSSQFRPASGVTDTDLNDGVYRLLIKAKIGKNNSDATMDGIILAIGNMVETAGITIIDPEDMTFSLNFTALTTTEQFVLDTFNVVPSPQGVRYTGYTIG